MPEPVTVPPEATADVGATMRWLEDQGWRLVEERGPEAMGDRLYRWRSLAGDELVVTRDRSQWMCSLHLVGWERPWDLDLLLVAVTGEIPAGWDAGRRWSELLPEQLPVGVTWIEALPRVLVRLRGDAGAQRRVVALARQRADALVGPLPPGAAARAPRTPTGSSWRRMPPAWRRGARRARR